MRYLIDAQFKNCKKQVVAQLLPAGNYNSKWPPKFIFLILGRKQLRDNKMMNKTEFSMKNYMLIQIFIKKY